MDDDVFAIQRLYPQVFLACHTRHVRARSTAFRLSAADSSLLAHLDRELPITAGELAAHLGVGGPAVSAALVRLERLGYLERGRRTDDRRLSDLRLTAKGAEALQAASVLDTELLGSALARLTPAERRQAVLGLELLARGARELQARGAKAQPPRGASRAGARRSGGRSR
jgi:DNA-binding MarR family transcriptional regulator